MSYRDPSVQRLRAVIRGAVQGVGFRPFVYRLAAELHLAGWVANAAEGVTVEVEGERAALEHFMLKMKTSPPPRAVIHHVEYSWLDALGLESFEIRASGNRGLKTTLILPDIASCADCLREMFDPGDRRYRYPFTNCTNCGPRFSIIEALPYDRESTSMQQFAMCSACAREYHDPRDRRFNAQPIACSLCGPHLELWDERGSILARHDAALRQASECIRAGKIVAVKGVGGFQLVVDARNDGAVERLRVRKRRTEKPFALMYSSLDAVHRDCAASELEARLVSSPEAPIVLLPRRTGATVAPSVAPQNPLLGVMLPSTPLHHLLMADLGFAIVATSGNLSDEPICIDEQEALDRLGGIADVFLVHNRPIVRPVDDSIVRVVCGREIVLRCARGYAPLPIEWSESLPPILALGAHLKNSVALSVGTRVFISQHIGDLSAPQTHAAFRSAAADLPRLYDAEPTLIACDLHPDYFSTQHAVSRSAPVHRVQHHWAHVLACMAENEAGAPALGVAWDGTGLGTDGTIWGGEFLRASEDGFERVAHLRPFRLPGGDTAVKEPRRSALGLLYEVFGAGLFEKVDLPPIMSFSAKERNVLKRMLERGVNSPVATSAGRLFDAVASLLDLHQISTFEGQAAMSLEFALKRPECGRYSFELSEELPYVIDWEPMILSIIEDRLGGTGIEAIAAKFHETLSAMIVAVAERIGEARVFLTGGCFQNKHLTELSVRRLREAGFQPYSHRRVPPNDGGIALGQIISAARSLGRRTEASLDLCLAH